MPGAADCSGVDGKALVQALKSSMLGAAALDVLEVEPKVPEQLLAMDTVVLQPHHGSECRFAEGHYNRLRELATDLVHRRLTLGCPMC